MLRTIDTAQLRPGMYVHRLLGPWLKHPFWRTSFLAVSDAVEKLHASPVEQLVIDTERGLDLPQGRVPLAMPGGYVRASAQAADDLAAPPAASLEAELLQARRICLEGRDRIAAMFGEVRMGRAVDPQSAMPMVEDIVGSVTRHPSALVSVARLKTADDYTYLHCVATSALMGMLARKLGLPGEQILEAAMGGLLHDMGKARMPLAVLNKPGKLTDEEFAIMQSHPGEGERLLRDSGVDNEAILGVVGLHHEKFAGGGYPRRLAGEGIPLLARMAAVCDVYDAITSNRPYKQAWDPGESLRRMASWEGHFDQSVLHAFVRCLGIYPTGTLVRLSSDQLAVVLEQRASSLLAPQVRVFYSAAKKRLLPVHDVDLSTSGGELRITGTESAAQWGFRELEKLWVP
jgi:putative nucleotidyltransferase with HDIG domain